MDRITRGGNLQFGLPSEPATDELVEALFERGQVRIERIVSIGQSMPEAHWYDDDTDEWVLLFSGEARLRIEGEGEDRELRSGDWVFLPAHCRHRVIWTSTDPPAVWIAVHVAPVK
jgi:cupin 2 domain-containing protein